MPVDTGRIVTAVTSAARLLTGQFPRRAALIINDGDLTEERRGGRRR